MSRRIAIFLVTLAAVCFFRSGSAQEYYAQEKCSYCHIRESVYFDPKSLPPEALAGFDEERICASCHNGTVRDSREALWRGAQHPAAVPGGKTPGRKRCSGCHSPHGKGGWGVLAGTSISLWRGGDTVCTGCHREYDSRTGIHRTGFPEGGCRECHRAHGGSGNGLLREGGAGLCLRCHTAVGAARSGGHPFSGASAGSSDGKSLPPCASCHPVHRRGRSGDGPAAMCRGCHAFSPRGAEAARNSHPDESNCLSCHSFHKASGGGGKGFRGKDMRPDFLCGTCHGRYVASSPSEGKKKATHVTRGKKEGEELCFRCHRIHEGVQGTRLLATGKLYFCLDCHERQNTISETAGIVLSHPVFERVEEGRLTRTVRERRIPVGPKGEIVCATCHSVHGATPSSPLLSAGFERAESCLWCHEGMRGKDHLPQGTAAKGALCGDCHTVHGKTGGSKGPWEQVCSSCHPGREGHPAAAESRKIPRPSGLPVFDAKGRIVPVGGAISCPTCHDPHGRPSRGKRLRKEYFSAGFLCSACHTDKETVALTPHDLRGIAGMSICEPCHLPHGGSKPWMGGWKLEPGDLGKGACRSCHRERGMASPVSDAGHPVNVYVQRPVPEEFPLFGPDGKRKEKGEIACATCHEVHGTGMAPNGAGVGSLLRTPAEREGEQGKSCSACHAEKDTVHRGTPCRSCHPPHQEWKGGRTCKKCHKDREGGMAPVHEAAGKGCSACHPEHDAGKRVASEDRCVACHPRTERIRETSHAGIGKGACGPCHPAHASLDPFQPKRKPWEEVFVPDIVCLRCHNPEGIGPVPPWTEHPKRKRKVATSYGAVVTMETPITMIGRLKEGGRPLFPLFDEGGSKSSAGRMGCLTCHDPHAGNIIKEKGNRRSAAGYLRDPSGIFLADVCAPCHRGEAEGHVRNFHNLPRKTD